MGKLPLVSLFVFSLLISSCSSFNSPSVNMLEKRADYEGKYQMDDSLKTLDNEIFTPNRTRPKITDIYVYPHEMATGDYFRGGWIRILIAKGRWEMEGPKKEKIKKPTKKKKKPKTNKSSK